MGQNFLKNRDPSQAANQLEKTLFLLLAAMKPACPPPQQEHNFAAWGGRQDQPSEPLRHFISFRGGSRSVYGHFLIAAWVNSGDNLCQAPRG